MNENVVAKSMTVTPTAYIGSGITDSSFGTVECIVKPDGAHGVAAEYVCFELAKFLGLPVSPGFITYLDGFPQFVTMRVGGEAGCLPRGDSSQIIIDDPYNAAGMGVFDALAINSDRHPGNFSFINGRLFMFDHGHCMFEGTFERTTTAQFVNTGNIQHAQAWIRKVKSIPRSYLKAIFDHIRSIGWPTYGFDDELPDWDAWEADLWNRIKKFDQYVRLPARYVPGEAITFNPPARRWGGNCSIAGCQVC